MRLQNSQNGFSLIELIMVIVILSILTVTAISKWPSGLGEDAAAMEFRRAVRYAQHMAITREWKTAGEAWGIEADAATDTYTVQRADGSEQETSLDYSNRSLIGNTTIADGSVFFNGLGEPINTVTGNPLAVDTLFTVGTATTVTVFQETGYVQ